jgi:hypothetical protein
MLKYEHLIEGEEVFKAWQEYDAVSYNSMIKDAQGWVILH